MRLTVPPLEIAEDEGFSDDKDIFKRKGFGEQLSNLIENTEGELVIALDAPWGEGKSTFVKMWRGHLKTNGIQSIYFDAFENDHQSAPFLALAAEIYNLIGKNEDEKTKFKDVAVSALKTTGRISLRVGIKALTAGILDETVFVNYGTNKDLSKETAAAVDGYVSNRLKSASKDKESIKEFRDYLENLPTLLGTNGKPLVFIIDELDRCKPPFALEIVEIVKHLFAVPNITFVLVLNRTQLEASVKNEYGTADASAYLQKFINLWVSLPKVQVSDERTTKVYFSYCVKQMGIEAQTDHQKIWMAMFEELIDHYNLSLREIERCLTNFALIWAGLHYETRSSYQWIAVYLSIIKVRYQPQYKRLSSSKPLSHEELFEKTDLSGLNNDAWVHRNIEPNHALKWVLRYHLSNDDTKKKLRAAENPIAIYESLSINERTIEILCGWLDSVRMS